MPANTDAYSTELNIYDGETMSAVEAVKELTGRIASNDILLLFMLFMFVWLVVSTAISLNVLWNFVKREILSKKVKRIRSGIQTADQGSGSDRAGIRPQSGPQRSSYTSESQRSSYTRLAGGYPPRTVGDPYYVSRPDAEGKCLGYTQCDLFDAESMTVEGLRRIAERFEVRTSGYREQLTARVNTERNARDARNCQCGFSVAGGNHWDM